MTGRPSNPAVRYAAAGVLAGLGLAWLLGLGRAPAARAQTAVPPGAAGTFAFTSPTGIPGSPAAQLLYLVDAHSQSFAVYRIDPQLAQKTIRLVGARQFGSDLKLTEFNNDPPSVAEIEAMVPGR